jgi:CBS domain-containing protein
MTLCPKAVIDPEGRLVGVITVDDVVDVITEEAEEDIRLLSGVGDEEMTDTVLYTARSRFVWLLINLAQRFSPRIIIGLFDATIEQMVALAILMPIVASMGGNAGTQTMTVAVRALATRDLGGYNALRIVGRETAVGLLNGVAFAIITGRCDLFLVWKPAIGRNYRRGHGGQSGDGGAERHSDPAWACKKRGPIPPLHPACSSQLLPMLLGFLRFSGSPQPCFYKCAPCRNAEDDRALECGRYWPGIFRSLPHTSFRSQ